ncbi:MAG: primosomal protein N' [Candidatus Omnitrophica bacterium]|nr:primosomal protein N' [Candidatus Omnitrophota bacterium]
MSDKLIAKVVLGLPLSKSFDYSIPENLRKKIKAGSRVNIIFNRRNMIGYVQALTDKSQIKKLNPIISLIDEAPILPGHFLSLMSKISSYYCSSLGEMIEAALPDLIRKGRQIPLDYKFPKEPEERPKVKEKFSGFVYRSIDEEKKSEFFVERIKEALEKNKQVIFLLPDTSLVDVWVKRLRSIFKGARIICLHSRLSKKEAFLAWLSIKSSEADIVVGSRAAIFSPLVNIGLIIIDSEDNFVYKQETRPYYNARDVAIMLAKDRQAMLVLSSISPSAEVFHSTIKNKFKFISEQTDKARLPKTKIIDLRYQRLPRGGNLFSLPFTERIRNYLEQEKRILIFLNRRGFATFLRCKSCGHSLECARCSSHLIYYYHTKTMQCPHCNYKIDEPKVCPKCNFNLIYFGGFGIQRLESETHRLFPGVKITCLDSLEAKAEASSSNIIITSQFGLKEGLIKEDIDLCAVVSMDNILNLAQLRSSEEAFRILLHLRALAKDELVVQTYICEHRVFSCLNQGDYEAFIKAELNDRKSLNLPPYRHLIALNLKSAKLEELNLTSQKLFKLLKNRVARERHIEVFSPIEDIPFKLRSKFRLQILIKTAKVEEMNRIVSGLLPKLKAGKAVSIGVNVDI